MGLLRRLFLDPAAVLIAAGVLLFATTTWGQDKPASSPWWQLPEVRACCSQADAVIADVWRVQPDGSVLATVTEGTSHTAAWAQNVIGKTFLVPADRVLNIPGNPMGRALLFIGPTSHHVFCFALGPMI
jgi:hypothetical protein